jgi:pimeloyl-ACP methyl ester carboxylesterase
MSQAKKSEIEDAGQTISLPDGRQLGYCAIGEGKPIFYFHGTASSRLEVLLLKKSGLTQQVRIIGVDRPGYGLSTFAPRKSLRDFADDTNFLADHLGLERFAILGWSGGGPFLLTYFALFPERVTKAVIVGSPALPFNAATAHNNPFARYAMRFRLIGIWALKKFRASVLEANKDIGAFLRSRAGKSFLSEWPAEDAKFFADQSWLTLMYGSIAEAFRQGDTGVKTILQEHQLFMKNWDAPISRIPPEKLYIWQGTNDKTCQTENAYRIVKIVPGAHLEIFEGKGHCVMFDNIEKLRKILLS